MLAELVGGLYSHSIAILTDSAHMFSDVLGFMISIFSIFLTKLPANNKMSYGYHRAEVIGALGSIMIIWALTIWLIVEAILRINNPQTIDGKLMLTIALLGLLFNIIMLKILHGSHGHDHEHGHDPEHEVQDHEHEGHDHEAHNHEAQAHD